jgi:hypothetical protein
MDTKESRLIHVIRGRHVERFKPGTAWSTKENVRRIIPLHHDEGVLWALVEGDIGR